MKKAKVILTALVVLSAVGAALAFKARNQNIWCGTQNAIAGSSLCTIFVQTDYTTTAASNTYCTKSFGQLCVDPTTATIFKN